MVGFVELAFEAVADLDHVGEASGFSRETGIGLVIAAARTGSR